MKTRFKLLLWTSAVALSGAAAFGAENAVVLESFEENIDSVAQGNWGEPDPGWSHPPAVHQVGGRRHQCDARQQVAAG
ncbi:MAG: hypothetical protein M5U12_00195 [Verrucomicrobia bacterium]|nr:hypothetical protein [Verrucomicrobiota bacterium]